MTEISSSTDSTADPDVEVKVRAQVMSRDDTKGGWFPLEGGGMAHISLRRVPVICGEEIIHHYIVHGLLGRREVLRCVLTKDVQYDRATPTFHHWKIEGKRYGLTFQTTADARNFDRGINSAVNLLNDANEGLQKSHPAVDETVFMNTVIPLTRKSSLSPSDSTVSTTTSSPPTLSPAHPPHLNDVVPAGCHSGRMSYAPHSSLHRSSLSATAIQAHECEDIIWIRNESNRFGDCEMVPLRGKSQQSEVDRGGGADLSYVQFNKNEYITKELDKHDYSYPELERSTSPTFVSLPITPARSTSSSSRFPHSESSERMLKVNNFRDSHPPLPCKKLTKKELKRQEKKKLSKQRAKCIYCQQVYVLSENHKGVCEDCPPDRALQCVETVSCLCCARGVLYHCVADSEANDYSKPCVCDSSDENNGRKWTALLLMSLLLPCLWCYWPLYGCYSCCKLCHCCGGRHKPTM